MQIKLNCKIRLFTLLALARLILSLLMIINDYLQFLNHNIRRELRISYNWSLNHEQGKIVTHLNWQLVWSQNKV